MSSFRIKDNLPVMRNFRCQADLTRKGLWYNPLSGPRQCRFLEIENELSTRPGQSARANPQGCLIPVKARRSPLCHGPNVPGRLIKSHIERNMVFRLAASGPMIIG